MPTKILVVIAISACGFLLYVLAQFRREDSRQHRQLPISAVQRTELTSAKLEVVYRSDVAGKRAEKHTPAKNPSAISRGAAAIAFLLTVLGSQFWRG